MEEAASTWGKTNPACSVAAHRWNLVCGDDFKAHPTEWNVEEEESVKTS